MRRKNQIYILLFRQLPCLDIPFTQPHMLFSSFTHRKMWTTVNFKRFQLCFVWDSSKHPQFDKWQYIWLLLQRSQAVSGVYFRFPQNIQKFHAWLVSVAKMNRPSIWLGKLANSEIEKSQLKNEEQKITSGQKNNHLPSKNK